MDLGQFVDAHPLLSTPTILTISRLTMPDVYLVIGGSGLLGRHIAKQLQDRGDNVSVLDIVQRYDDIPFYHGDISDEGVVLSVLQQVR